MFALAETRRPEAFAILRDYWPEAPADLRESLLVALAMFRLPAANDFLIGLIAGKDPSPRRPVGAGHSPAQSEDHRQHRRRGGGQRCGVGAGVVQEEVPGGIRGEGEKGHILRPMFNAHFDPPHRGRSDQRALGESRFWRTTPLSSRLLFMLCHTDHVRSA